MNPKPNFDDAAKHRAATTAPASGGTIYTCPMHPEVQQDHPGDCPKCGMALERATPTAAPDGADRAELHDGAAMSLSSVSVISNALRLGKGKL
jgi:Cu+-exporting ATPase